MVEVGVEEILSRKSGTFRRGRIGSFLDTLSFYKKDATEMDTVEEVINGSLGPRPVSPRPFPLGNTSARAVCWPSRQFSPPARYSQFSIL